MDINSTDYNLIIVEKYPTSFLSQGQVNFGERIIYNDKSLTDFFRVPNDYINQIKLTILEIFVRKEPKTSQQCSPLLIDVHSRLKNRSNCCVVSVGSLQLSDWDHQINIFEVKKRLKDESEP
ncbi:hypothetical protein H5410_023411 [Solanum commersonii]|uniref:Uncharacterized protein n=1 Tax=Solanum commersonii TaxID=4109 RepID=A0A9J5ZHI0_SOLCO|nr:hypothetical protein H5410_023411 [Solanum commersonii]